MRDTVFVLGAGFTKAFVRDAPLLRDHFGVETLLADFKRHSFARKLLELELARTVEEDRTARDGRPRSPDSVDATFGSRIDIERLMTRLDSGMPYDTEYERGSEVEYLLSRVKLALTDRIQQAKRGDVALHDLARFAGWCVQTETTCITFNYDDVFDNALCNFRKVLGIKAHVPPLVRYWEPEGGYGFYCRPAWHLVGDLGGSFMSEAPYLLKLHGSINWYAIRGATRPYSFGEIYHLDQWSGKFAAVSEDLVRRHLEVEPFIVPPVLAKSNLLKEPVLSAVWSTAFKVLSSARRIVFVGYSLPATDIAARVLFQEAVSPGAEVRVVNSANHSEQKQTLQDTYAKVFAHVAHPVFDFRDARDWALEYRVEDVT